MVSKNIETTIRERHLVFGRTEKSKSLTVNKVTSKIHISNQMAIKDNPNLVKEVVNLTKAQNQIQDQIKISIMDLKVTLVLSVKMLDKTVLQEIKNLIRIIQKV